jgi:mono/diheme cytochrome c family protein
MNKNSFYLILALMVSIGLMGCEKHDPNELDAKTLYENYCAGCHGDDGSGRFLRSVPANVKTEKSFSEIVHQIKNGSSEKHKGQKMPGFSELSDQQVKLIASYLLKISRQ